LNGLFLNPLRARGLHPTEVQIVQVILRTHKQGPGTFESIISKSTQRLGLVGDRYPPGPLEGEKPCLGHKPVASQGRRIVGHAKTTIKIGRPKKAMGSRPDCSRIGRDLVEAVCFSRARHPQMSGIGRNGATGFSSG
jgi:hypothetical protein